MPALMKPQSRASLRRPKSLTAIRRATVKDARLQYAAQDIELMIAQRLDRLEGKLLRSDPELGKVRITI